jgi:hypothetical protein
MLETFICMQMRLCNAKTEMSGEVGWGGGGIYLLHINYFDTDERGGGEGVGGGEWGWGSIRAGGNHVSWVWENVKNSAILLFFVMAHRSIGHFSPPPPYSLPFVVFSPSAKYTEYKKMGVYVWKRYQYTSRIKKRSFKELKVPSSPIRSAWERYHWIGLEKDINRRYSFFIFIFFFLKIWKEFKVLSRFIQKYL